MLLESVALRPPDPKDDSDVSQSESHLYNEVNVGLLQVEGVVQEESNAVTVANTSTLSSVQHSEEVSPPVEQGPSYNYGSVESVQPSLQTDQQVAFPIDSKVPIEAFSGNTESQLHQVEKTSSRADAPCTEHDAATQNDRNLEQLSEILLDSDPSTADEETPQDTCIQETCVKKKSSRKVHFAHNVKESDDGKIWVYFSNLLN